jgi:hypothetical protein
VLEHSVAIDGIFGNDLQDVPVFNDPAVFVQPENIHAGPVLVLESWPFLMTMKHDVIALRDCAFEVNSFARKILRHFLEIFDERFLSIGNAGIVLNVCFTSIFLDRFAWLALIEHEVIEGHHVLLVALKWITHRMPFCLRDSGTGLPLAGLAAADNRMTQ